MPSINERILYIRESLGLSRKAFGERLGVSDSVIKNMDYNVTAPKQLFLNQLCKEFHVNPIFLYDGVGDPFLELDNENALMLFALKTTKDSDMNWIHQFLVSLMSMTPEELSVLKKFAQIWIDNVNKSEKEQDS